MDYEAFSNRPVTFPANSNTGDTVCTNVNINNDGSLEPLLETFFLDITDGGGAGVEPGRERATVNIEETNDGGETSHVE